MSVSIVHDATPPKAYPSSSLMPVLRCAKLADAVMSVLRPTEAEMYSYRVPELVRNVRNVGRECTASLNEFPPLLGV